MSKKASLELRRRQTEAYVSFTHLDRKLEELMAKLLEDEGLGEVSPRRAAVLVILFNARKPLPARRIAERLGVSEVTVGRFVHALCELGWVEREKDPNDARVQLISPTPKAYDTLPSFIEVSNQALDMAFAGFDETQIAEMNGYLRQLAKNLGIGLLPGQDTE